MNELAADTAYHCDLKRWRNIYAAEKPEIKTKGSFVYAMRGRKLVREDFAALTGLKLQIITRHGTDVNTSPAILLSEIRHNQSHMGKLGLHRKMVDRFINFLNNIFAIEIPLGRVSTNDKPLIILPGEMHCSEVYKRYMDNFTDLSTDASEGS